MSVSYVCQPRSKAALGAQLDGLHVELEPKWQPRDGLTHCNQAAEAALDGLDAPLPHGLLANQQQAWLDSPAGRSAGWEECTADRAGNQGDAGCPTVVTLHEEPHGHIAVVRGRDEHGNLLVWQAGGHNYNRATLRQCFTVEQLARVQFFTHA